MVSYNQEVEDVKKYYADLLILQYKGKTRARETVKLGAEMYLGDGLVFQLNDILNIDLAEGAQLDIIGKILGVPRNVQGLVLDRDYFSFEKTNAYGFSDDSQLSQGYFKKFNNSIGSVYSLTDIQYRPVLKFKALYNLRRGSWKDLDYIYYTIFGDNVEIVNNKNLSITFNVANNAIVPFEAIKQLGYVTAPMGVQYTYNYLT